MSGSMSRLCSHAPHHKNYDDDIGDKDDDDSSDDDDDILSYYVWPGVQTQATSP